MQVSISVEATQRTFTHTHTHTNVTIVTKQPFWCTHWLWLLALHGFREPVGRCLWDFLNDVVYLEAQALDLSVPHRQCLTCCKRKEGGSLVFNAQSRVLVISLPGRNTIHLITSQRLFHSSRQFSFHSLWLERFRKKEVEWTRNAKISRLEALEVGKACYARLHSYSRLKKREPLIVLGSHQKGS